ncbi:MAG: hypothetical protein Q8Q09_28860 [Deltaproteobacteria bacterium]|nr:hypothetical protein [Deltaproteobacteria bacterium]
MAYRDDRLALEEQRTELQAKLALIRSKIAGNHALEGELLATTQELEALYAKLNAMTPSGAPRHSLPLLQTIHVASPCNVPWSSMSGDDHVRHCDLCDKNVYDLSSLTRDQAESLVRSNNGQMCVKFFRRADGTILTQDCPIGVTKRARVRRRAAVVAFALTATAAASIFATLRERNEPSRSSVAIASQKPVELQTHVADTKPISPPSIHPQAQPQPLRPGIEQPVSRPPTERHQVVGRMPLRRQPRTEALGFMM